MAFSSGAISQFTFGGTDISPYTTSASISIERDITDINPIGGNPVSKVVGPYAATISLEGAYDPTVAAIFEASILAAVPATATFAYRPSGSGGGTRSFSGSAYVASWGVDTPGDDTATWSAELAVSGTVTAA